MTGGVAGAFGGAEYRYRTRLGLGPLTIDSPGSRRESHPIPTGSQYTETMNTKELSNVNG